MSDHQEASLIADPAHGTNNALLPEILITLLATGLQRHLAHLHKINESVLMGDRRFELAIPDQSSPSPEAPPAGA